MYTVIDVKGRSDLDQFKHRLRRSFGIGALDTEQYNFLVGKIKEIDDFLNELAPEDEVEIDESETLLVEA